MSKNKFAVTVLMASMTLGPIRNAAAGGGGNKGTSGAQFLKIAPGARPSAMGEAFAAIADDVNTIYYNPAGLATLKRVEVTGMHNSLFQGINYEFAALSVPLLSWVDSRQDRNTYGVLGTAIYNLSVGGIERRSVTETDAPTERFGASDFAYALSYAYALPDTGVSAGLSAKYIDSTIDSSHAQAFAADGGVLYRRAGACLGGGIRNLGTGHKFGNAGDPLPTVIFTGAGYRFRENMLGSLELNYPRDNSMSFAFGGEYRHSFAHRLSGALRAGYNSRNRDAGGMSGASFGLGVGYDNFNFDFAFVPFGDLGNAFKYSLLVKF